MAVIGSFTFTAAVFDLDGTLLDSMGFWRDLDRRFLARRGIDTVPEDYLLAVAHLGAEETAVYTKKRFGLGDTPEEMIAEWNNDAKGFYGGSVQPKPGAREYISYLHEQGVKLAIATASMEELYMPALKRLNMDRYFGTFVSAEECERKKGFPDVYELACRRLGCEISETVVFEDILAAVRGAKSGGFFTAAVYDSESGRDTELLRAEADFYITDYTMLIDRGVKE